MKASFRFALLVSFLLFVFASSAHSNDFSLKTFVGVINIHQNSFYPEKVKQNIRKKTNKSAVQKNKGATQKNDTYLLHTAEYEAPLILVFRNGTPDQPVLTGDKVQVVGVKTVEKFFVLQIKALPSNLLPF